VAFWVYLNFAYIWVHVCPVDPADPAKPADPADPPRSSTSSGAWLSALLPSSSAASLVLPWSLASLQ
jgi:hypothetical protein